VTDPAGEIWARTILGDRLEIETNQVGGEATKTKPFFDLPLAGVLQDQAVKDAAGSRPQRPSIRGRFGALDHGFAASKPISG
jgi:hypothetical protein